LSKSSIRLEQLDQYRWCIPKERYHGMNVDGMIYASSRLLDKIRDDGSLEQVANVATLPGIISNSFAMPDIHRGYGFPIGGVAAFDCETGIISPGGVGYDINCGISLLRSKIDATEISKNGETLADLLLSQVPCGVGVGGDIRLSEKEVRKVAELGAKWVVKRGLADLVDLERMEESGCLESSNPDSPSPRACERGFDQLGTLGSGNHFIEVQVVDEIYDLKAATILGLAKNRLTVMIHSGSRGFGYQICDDSLRKMGAAANRYGIELVDRQLACAPVKSPEGIEYAGMMAAAANYAWANRLALVSRVREIFENFFGYGYSKLGMGLVTDITHNIAKFEQHIVNGKKLDLCVHRKGATRAFGPGDNRVPAPYKSIGQPILIPGDMGRSSYVLTGTSKAMSDTFGSACHGAGRLLSRRAALKATCGRNISLELAENGTIVRARKHKTLGEEAPEAYKDVNSVVNVAVGAGLANKVARLKPLIVIKG
jgi:tRNA-splicing ligase RtcB (3'-phosphate/5'-hydroxy nucleic acid ligase)